VTCLIKDLVISYQNKGIPLLKVFPPHLPAVDLGLRRWATGSIYAMTFLATLSTTLGQVAQAIMFIVAAVFLVGNWRLLKHSPLIWLTFFFVGYVILRGIGEIFWGRPELRYSQWDGVIAWIRVGLLPTVTFGLALQATGDRLRHSLGTLFSLFMGILLYIILNLSSDAFFSALAGPDRYDFRLNSPLVAAFKIGTMLLGLLLFSGLIFEKSKMRGKMGWCIPGLWSLALLFLGAAFIATKSISAWLAFLIAMISGAAIWLWMERERVVSTHGWKLLITPVWVLLIAIIGVSLFSQQIENRWDGVSGTVEETVQLSLGRKELQDIPADSVGIRVALQVIGINYILEKPLFGHGPADPRYLQSEYPGLPHQFSEFIPTNFHNAYNDLLLRLGLTGYLVVALFVALLSMQAWKMVTDNGPGRLLGLYFFGFVLLAMIWAIANQNFERFTLINIYAPVLGVVCAGAFSRLMDSAKSSRSVS
jgi:O-antigen ligase